MAAQLPAFPLMAVRRDEPHVDAETLRRYTFVFLLLIASGLIYAVGNPGSSFAAEDVLTLFLYWNIFMVIFFVSFVLHTLPAVARIVALVAEALKAYLSGNRALLLF